MKLTCLKHFMLYIAAFIFIGSAQSCKEGTLYKININADWKFKLLNDSDIEEEFETTDFNDSDWESVSLPHTANIEPKLVNNQWQGICWYRKEFDVPKNNNSNKKVFLEFEAAMNYSKIWVNGLEVSEHHGGYLPVAVDVTKYVKEGQKNTVAVRLNNTDNPVTGPKPLKILDFNTYGGLYRNAWLTIKEDVYISHPVLANKVAGGGIFITYPKVSEEESIVKVKTNIVNENKEEETVELVNSIFRNGKLIKDIISSKISIKPNSDQDITEEITLPNALLWSPNTPNLYTLETKIVKQGKVIGKETTRFGIREFEFQGNDLFINGKKTFLRGVNRHQEYPFVGYALSDNAQYRDAKKIKDAGFDYIRLSHYPQSPAFMDACDELGLVVVDAILGWQFYKDMDSYRNYCYRSATELIRRDRNHPCVLAWEVSLNETKMPIFFMEELDRIVHAEFPGDNVYSCGWKDDVYDIYLQARQHRILRPHALKDKPLSVSEYGDWEYFSNNAGLNQDKLPKNIRAEKSSRQARGYGEARMLQQSVNVQEAHNDNLSTKAYSDSYWVMYDYNRGYYDNLEESGLMDIYRLPKFAYYFYKSQRAPNQGVVLNIASYWDDKSSLDVTVYSNCDEVKLYLNNQLIGAKKPDNNSISKNLSHPPFTFNLNNFKEGELKALGFINNEQVVEHIIKTPKAPTGLKIWLDESGKAPQSGVNDVLFLYIAAVDENGTIIPNFSEIMNLNIDGDLEIMNVGDVKAEAGIATALVRIGNRKGLINIKAKSGELSGDFKVNVN